MTTLYKFLIFALFFFSNYVFSQYYEEQQAIYTKYENTVEVLNRKKEFEIKSLSANNYVQNKKLIQNKYSTLISNAYLDREKRLSALKTKYENISKKENQIAQQKYDAEVKKQEQLQEQQNKQEEIAERNEKIEYIKTIVNQGDQNLKNNELEEALQNYERAENILADDLNDKSESVTERITITKQKINLAKKQEEEREIAERTKARSNYLQQAEEQRKNKNFDDALNSYSAAQAIEQTADVDYKIAQTEKERNIVVEQQKLEAQKTERRKKTLGTILGVGAVILGGVK